MYMENDLFQNIKQGFEAFQKSLQENLPAMEEEINRIISTENKDKNAIEHTLDILLSLTQIGIGEELFIKLLEYYKTIDTKGAAFYWNEFDSDNE